MHAHAHLRNIYLEKLQSGAGDRGASASEMTLYNSPKHCKNTVFLTLLHCQDLYNCPKHCKDPVFDIVTWTRPLQLTKTLQKHNVFVTLTLTGALQLSKPLQKHSVFDPYADKTPYN